MQLQGVLCCTNSAAGQQRNAVAADAALLGGVAVQDGATGRERHPAARGDHMTIEKIRNRR